MHGDPVCGWDGATRARIGVGMELAVRTLSRTRAAPAVLGSTISDATTEEEEAPLRRELGRGEEEEAPLRRELGRRR